MKLMLSSSKLRLVCNSTVFVMMALFVTSCSQMPSRTSTQGSTSSIPAYQGKQRNKVVQSAYQVLGSPYKYGGTTTRGFDCSGLTTHAYRAANISIPRTAGQQRDHSRTIKSYSQLLPGDLIFFKTGAKTDHVGIYTGDGKFIHASTSQRRVIQAKLDTPYWRRNFVKFGTYISN